MNANPTAYGSIVSHPSHYHNKSSHVRLLNRRFLNGGSDKGPRGSRRPVGGADVIGCVATIEKRSVTRR